MIRLLKILTVVLLFAVFIVGAVVLRFYAVTDINKRRISTWFTTRMCRIALKVMGISYRETGSGFLSPNGKLIVSNHMSYLDIMIYAAIKPSVFISSVEMQKTPFLGFIAKLGGTFFVERRNPKLVRLEIDKIAELIKSGFNVYLFPEGTSTDGSEILPFRSSLLAAASAARVEVVPACLKYQTIDGQAFSSKNCDCVCWYGDMYFVPHFFNLLSTRDVQAKATFFEPLDTKVSDRKFITEKARQLITAEYFGAA